MPKTVGRGLKVLIAEDELMIADLLEEALIMSGYQVCGIARTVDEGVALVESHEPDLGIFDVRLAHDGRGPDIARRIGRPSLGVLYATGTGTRQSTLTRSDGIASITKPYRIEDVIRALGIIREIMTTGTTAQPFPSGFRLLPERAPFAIQEDEA